MRGWSPFSARTALSVSLSAVLVVGFVSFAPQSASAESGTVIVDEPFSAPGPRDNWVFAGATRLDGEPEENVPVIFSDALLLTPASGGQSGFALYDLKQPAIAGIDVTFRLSQWGGSGADGITFFLKNGDDNNKEPGVSGSRLGYAADDEDNGISGALLGIGFDRFGNFTNFNDSGCSPLPDELEIGRKPNSLTIRGPGTGTAGYCLLDSTDISDRANADYDGWQRVGASDEQDRGPGREVRVKFDPDPGTVSVWLDDLTRDPLLNVEAPEALRDADSFKFGFSASTGGSTNNHSVWDVVVKSVTALPPPEIQTLTLPGAVIGQPYEGKVDVDGGVNPVKVQIVAESGSLPAGLSLAEDGSITGTPTQTGTFSFSVRATDANSTSGSSVDLNIVVAPALTGVTPDSGSAGGGTVVTLEGSGFGTDPAALSVKIGGVEMCTESESCVIGSDEAPGTTITFSIPERVGNTRTVGAEEISLVVDGIQSPNVLTFLYRPVLEAPSTGRVVLNQLASRSQRGQIVRTPGPPYFVIGTDSRTGETYIYETDLLYSGRNAYSRESDERTSSAFILRTSPTSASTPPGNSQVAGDSILLGALMGSCSPRDNNVGGIESYCSVFGPEVYSEAFYAKEGQSLSFDWAAIKAGNTGNDDDYEVYAFLVRLPDDADSVADIPRGSGIIGQQEDPEYLNAHTLVLHGLGRFQTTFRTESVPIPEDGLYRFRFVNGSYDATGGFALGSEMYIKKRIVVGETNIISVPPLNDRLPSNLGSSSLEWDDYVFSVTATSNEPVTVTSVTPSQCSASISGTTATVVRVATGTCTLSFSQEATGSFAPAALVTRSFRWLETAQPASAPTISSIQSGDGELVISFIPPSADGGNEIFNYAVSLDGGTFVPLQSPTTTSPLTVSGLQNGTQYSVRIRALTGESLDPILNGAISNTVLGTPQEPPPPPRLWSRHPHHPHLRPPPRPHLDPRQ